MGVLLNGTNQRMYRSVTLSGEKTIAGWVKWVSVVNLDGICSFDYNAAIQVESTYISVYDGSDFQNGTVAPSAGTWYHVAWTVAGDSSDNALKLYVNGSLDVNTTRAVSAGSPYAIALGNDNEANYTNAHFAYWKCWTAVLSLEEIQREVYTIRPKKNTDLFGFWPIFPGSSSERVRDYSGNSYDLSELNSPTDGDAPPISWGAPRIFAIPWSGNNDIVLTAEQIDSNIHLGWTLP